MATNDGTLTPAQIGAIGLALDGHRKRFTRKLASVGTDPDERFYMLATYCFDLTRKLHYISLALQPFWESADPGLARRIRDDSNYIDADDPSWRQMAERAEDVMQAIFAEIQTLNYEEIRNARADVAP